MHVLGYANIHYIRTRNIRTLIWMKSLVLLKQALLKDCLN